MRADAVISPDGRYRYLLTRDWSKWLGVKNRCAAIFIMLNPSTATAMEDDPTIRRCITFAKRWELGKLVVGNLCAYRATRPRDLFAAEDYVGPDNMAYLRTALQDAASRRFGWRNNKVVLAWGAHGDRVLG